jgi:hypothetical protein
MAAAAALSATSPIGPAGSSKPAPAAALARKVNLGRADLPGGTAWSSTPAGPTSAADRAESKRVLACAQRAVGHQEVISPDPFGLGTPAGDVQADVSSPQFMAKNGQDGLPGISSEVVVTTAAQAAADWRALDTTGAISCVAGGVKQAVEQGGAGTMHVSTSYLNRPSAEQAGAGLGVRFVITASGSKGRLVLDVWFYEVHQLEVEFTFVSETSPVAHSWESSVTGRVIGRADRLTA